MNPIYEFLHSMTLREVGENQSVVQIQSNDTVEGAVKILAKNKILSAPVVDEKGNCLGLVDMLDIVSSILKVAPDPVQLQENELRTLQIAGRAMAFEPVRNCVGASGRDPYIPVYEKNPSSSVVDFFAKGIHRVPILNEKNEIINSISQYSLIKLLSENLHKGKLKTMGEMTASNLGLGKNKPVTVQKEIHTVLQAFQLIQKENVSALAVIEEDGKLAGNFSATDLVGLYLEKWPSLLLSVGEYLQKHSPDSLNSICCTPETTLLNICKEMVNSKVHRLWMVDSDYHPIGVVSATDIFKIIRDFK